MKKLFVLALVLGVAGLANAGLSLEIDKHAQTVSAVGLFDQDAYLLLTCGGSGITSGILGPAAGAASGDTGMSAAEFAAAVGMTIEGDGIAFVVATFPGEGYKTGEYLIGTYDSGADCPVCLYFYSEITGESGLLDAWKCPEPATMLLLGLGGMLIRRK